MNLTARRAKWQAFRARRSHDGVRMRESYDWHLWAFWPIGLVGAILATLCYVYPQPKVYEGNAITVLQWAVFAFITVGFGLIYRLACAFRMTCPHCRKKLSSDTPWRCGQCQTEHTENIGNGFLWRCKNRECKERPNSIRCLHCQRTIPLEILPDPTLVPAYRRQAGPATLFLSKPKPPLPEGVLIRAKFIERYKTSHGFLFIGTIMLSVTIAVTVAAYWKAREDYKDLLKNAQLYYRPEYKKQYPALYALGQESSKSIKEGFAEYTRTHPWTKNTVGFSLLFSLASTFPLTVGLVGTIWYHAKPLRFRCPHCKAYMPSTMGWMCQSCGHKHADGKQFTYSYLRKCAKCKAPPEMIPCVRCHNAIPLVESVTVPTPRPVLNPAGAAIPIPTIVPPADPFDIYSIQEKDF